MLLKIKRIHIVILSAAVIVLGVGTLLAYNIFAPHESIRTSSQSDYPILPSPEAADSMDASLASQVENSTLIVDATVVKVLPDERRDYIPVQGSAESKLYEKQGITKSQYTVRPIQLKINDIYKGSSKEQTIMLYIVPVALDCTPNFKAGGRFVFMLSEYIGIGYSSVSLQDSYYYVASDNRIYPAVVTDLLKDLSGITLKDFKKEIKSLAAKK